MIRGVRSTPRDAGPLGRRVRPRAVLRRRAPTAKSKPAAGGAGAVQVALIRGINVGRSKRVAMADLRAMLEGLGYGEVRTLLNSGNVVFTSRRPDTAQAAARIEKGMAGQIGVPARVIVLTAAELAQVMAENPLVRLAKEPSRLFAWILAEPALRSRLEPLARQRWSPEALAIGKRAAYVWCPQGMLTSPLTEALGRALGEATTSRNWATMTKLHALAQGGK